MREKMDECDGVACFCAAALPKGYLVFGMLVAFFMARVCVAFFVFCPMVPPLRLPPVPLAQGLSIHHLWSASTALALLGGSTLSVRVGGAVTTGDEAGRVIVRPGHGRDVVIVRRRAHHGRLVECRGRPTGRQ